MDLPKTEKRRKGTFGIFPKSILFFVSGVSLALVAFGITIVKREERMLMQNLASRAELLAASVDRVSANAIVAEEQWTVVEQFHKLVTVSDEVCYAVVTKQIDGVSLVFTEDTWRQESLCSDFWRPGEPREKQYFLHVSSVTPGKVLHFRYPFSYEGYDWGWIHVGMSLEGYRKSLSEVYGIILLLAIPALLVGIGFSFLFARQMTQPISTLRGFARRLASGDLEQRVELKSNDELGDLASSLNEMAEELAESLDRKNELREKDILLREIHHRVKNNMQILTSLLRLQSRKLSEPKLKAIMQESEGRIRSMGLIHEKLYQSNSLSEIDFGGYARTLTGELRRMYSGSNAGVEIKLDTDDVKLGLDTALPCGLIVNELVSNSLKYAFPEGRSGEVVVKLRSLDEGGYEMVISDNGVGLAEGEKPEREGSLGMRLVTMLTEQLNGQIQTTNGTGLTSTIQFRGTQHTERV